MRKRKQPTSSSTSADFQLFAWVQLKRKQQFTLGEIAQAFGLSSQQAAKLLSRLSQKGLILRLTKGVYLAPEKLPPGGKWGPDRLWVLNRLMVFYEAQYQVTGQEAFHRHGLSDQLPNEVTVYNTRISGIRKIGVIRYRLIKVPAKRIGAIQPLEVGPSVQVPFSSLARALMDALYDWSRFNTIPAAFKWIEVGVLGKKGDELMAELIETTVRYGNVGTARRLGYVLTRLGVSSQRLTKLKRAAPATRSPIPLIPNLPKRGKTDPVWGVVVNE